MHYVAVIDKEPDSACGIRFPEAPGCFSAAYRFEEIVPNAVAAGLRGLETVRVNLSLDKGLLDTLDEAGRMRSMTRPAFIAKAAAREIRDPAR